MSDQGKPKPTRKERGEQLRALVVSWVNDSTFDAALEKQRGEIEEGTLTLNPEWGQVANEIMGGFMRQAEADQEPEDTGPKLILPQ